MYSGLDGTYRCVADNGQDIARNISFILGGDLNPATANRKCSLEQTTLSILNVITKANVNIFNLSCMIKNILH